MVINLTQQSRHFPLTQVFHLIFCQHSEKYLVCFYKGFEIKKPRAGSVIV